MAVSRNSNTYNLVENTMAGKNSNSGAAGMAEHKPSAASPDLQALIVQECLASSWLTANLAETIRLPNKFSGRIRVQRHQRNQATVRRY